MNGKEAVEYLKTLEQTDQIKEVIEAIERQSKIIRHAFADRVGFTPFITGEAGEKDRNEMPEIFFLCPAYGSDMTYIYRREKSSAPEY